MLFMPLSSRIASKSIQNVDMKNEFIFHNLYHRCKKQTFYTLRSQTFLVPKSI